MEKIEIVPNSVSDHMIPNAAYDDLYTIAFEHRLFYLPRMLYYSVSSNVIKSLGIHYFSVRDWLSGGRK